VITTIIIIIIIIIIMLNEDCEDEKIGTVHTETSDVVSMIET
jgi:hypothetical protein